MRKERRAIPGRPILIGKGTGTSKQPARQDSAALPTRPCPPSAARPQSPRQRSNATEDCQADLDAYISRMASEAPPLTSEQRDQLALILRSQRRS